MMETLDVSTVLNRLRRAGHEMALAHGQLDSSLRLFHARVREILVDTRITQDWRTSELPTIPSRGSPHREWVSIKLESWART